MNSMPSLRDERVHLRITEGEKRAIAERARRAGLSLSEFVRSAALNGEVAVIDTTPLCKVLYEMNREGNNLNQLARLAHAGGLDEADEVALTDTLGLMQRAYANVTECLISIREEADGHGLSLRSEAGDWAGDPDEPAEDAWTAREQWERPTERPTLKSEATLARKASKALSGQA